MKDPIIPKYWIWATLADIVAELESGKRPKGGVRGITSGVPSIGGEHLRYDGGFDFTKIKYVPEEFYNDMKRGKIENQDVLVVKDGATTGKTSFVDSNFPFEHACVNEHVFIMRTIKDCTYPQYLFYWILSPFGKNCVDDNFAGTAQGGINTSFLNKSKFSLAPFYEQKRIVAKIEKLFSKLDAGVEASKKVQALLKQYRQSVLKAAVEGKLTAEWREEHKDEIEPASELLQRILEERKEKWEEEQLAKYESKGKEPPKGWKEKYKEPAQPDTSDLPELPEGWVWGTVEQITEKITDGEHIRPQTTASGVPFLSAKDVRDEGVDFGSALFVNELDASRFRNRCNPEKGDILIVSRGATVGRCCIVTTDKIFCLLGSVILLKLNHILNSNYILFVLKSSDFQKKLFELSGSTAQQAIYLRDVKNLIIPVPPLEEQLLIGEEVDRIFSITSDIKSIVFEKLQVAQQLRQSILKRAFEGKLVSQDPNDEPASVLLERIKVGKAESEMKSNPKTKKKTKKKDEELQINLDV